MATEELEIWRDIEGYEGLYQVSNLGRVKRLDSVINTNINGVNSRENNFLIIFSFFVY